MFGIFDPLQHVREESANAQIVSLTGWFMFVLLYAYYGGALTMFFTSTPSMPFNTFREALQSYPTWKPVIMKGDLNYIQEMANLGDKDFQGNKFKMTLKCFSFQTYL